MEKAESLYFKIRKLIKHISNICIKDRKNSYTTDFYIYKLIQHIELVYLANWDELYI